MLPLSQVVKGTPFQSPPLGSVPPADFILSHYIQSPFSFSMLREGNQNPKPGVSLALREGPNEFPTHAE